MRKSNVFTKVTSVVLVMLVLAALFASCATPGDDDSTDTTTPAADGAVVTTPAEGDVSVETTPAQTEPAYEYADVNYGGATFAILNAEDRYNMIYHLMADTINGDALNDARYEVNAEISDRYGITITETAIPYNDLLPYAQNEVLSNTPVHDVFYLTAKQIATLMTAGYMHNLLDIEELNTDAEWWDQTLKEDGILKDKYLYYLGGNYHLQGFEGTTCVFINKKMTADLGLDMPYDIARDGKWTFDKMYEYADAADSLNGDESFAYNANGNSVYGIVTITNMMPAFIMGGDAYYVQKDASGNPGIAFTSERFTDVCNKIASLTSVAGLYKSKDEVALFMDDRTLMIGAEIKAAANELRDMTSEFGLLPVPKYDENQENYVTNMYWATHLLSIPVTCTDVERAAIVMDTLNYEANERVLPVYYERVCYKGLKDEDSIDMLKILRETRYLNWGLAYGWLDSCEPTVHSNLVAGNSNFSALFRSSQKVVQNLIDKTMNSLE